MSRNVRYTEVENAFILAADGKFTAEEVAKKLKRPTDGVYQQGRRLGVTFKPRPAGSLSLKTRSAAFLIPRGEREHYQGIINRIGERYELENKSAVFLKALDLADLWLEEEDE